MADSSPSEETLDSFCPVETPENEKRKIGKGDEIAKWLLMEELPLKRSNKFYKVENTENSDLTGVIRSEANDKTTLKQEAEVLRRLLGKKHMPQLLDEGVDGGSYYIVINDCGLTLDDKRVSTGYPPLGEVARLGINMLWAIKHIHDIGYIHGNVLPRNFVIGNQDKRILQIYDFSYSTEHIVYDWGSHSFKIRPARAAIAQKKRTNMLYCSLAVHERRELGRVDDLWSLFYILIRYSKLKAFPWKMENDEEKIAKLKRQLKEELFFGKKRTPPRLLPDDFPEELKMFGAYLAFLSYESRPDYAYLREQLINLMDNEGVSFNDPYKWEQTGPGSSDDDDDEDEDDDPFPAEFFEEDPLGV